jgi:bisphosphoglycerate-dependent phosphoglycerate mutase
LTSGSGASSGESQKESSNVQHGFVFAKVSESGDQEAGNEDKVMYNQCLLPSIVLHGFVDE